MKRLACLCAVVAFAVVLAAFACPLLGCGGGSGGRANNWDEMLWDEGIWQ